jgi:hypothetical protein
VQSLLDPPKRCDEKEGRIGESKEEGRERERKREKKRAQSREAWELVFCCGRRRHSSPQASIYWRVNPKCRKPTGLLGFLGYCPMGFSVFDRSCTEC